LSLLSLHVVTTDVQDVTICQVKSTTYIISCVFLNGSDASGCNYTLMSEEGSISAGSTERSNSRGEKIVVAGTVAVIQAHSSDVMLDVNSIVFTKRIMGMRLEPCPTGTTGKIR
jgi:hypothetical protein